MIETYDRYFSHRNSRVFQNTLILRPRVASCLKQRLKNKKRERIKNYILKCIYICISWYIKVANFRWKNADVSKTQGICHVIYMFFESSLNKVWLS